MTILDIDLKDPALYFNRELSWIEFNRRVLEEVQDASHPLLERIKFLAIFSSNLDEFFMIRVSGLKDQIEAGVVNLPPDGMTPTQQLERLRAIVLPMMQEQRRIFYEELLPLLDAAGIQIHRYADLGDADCDWLRAYFQTEILPVLTPIGGRHGPPLPPHLESQPESGLDGAECERGGAFRARQGAAFVASSAAA